MIERLRLVAVATALALVLAGCTVSSQDTDKTPAIDTAASSPSMVASMGAPNDPHLVGSAAPGVDISVTLPLSWSESTIVATGWLTAPQVRGRFAVGFAERDGGLEYSMIDSHGTILWRATRPAACTGFAVSTADGAPIVVLTDAAVTQHADGGATWQTTATAYDLASGTALWGPVPVPGTVQGPGLVFGESAPAATLGETGPRAALDPATGETIADEAATPGLSVVGEYDGIVITESGGAITGTDAVTGQTLWTMPGNGSAPTDRTPPNGAALLENPADGADVIGLATGGILATGTDAAAYEPLSGTWLFAAGTTFTGASADHGEWTRTIPGPVTISAAGMGLVYLRSGDAVRVLNALTGADAIAYPEGAAAAYAVPLAITSDAAALFRVNGDYLMATVQQPPG